MKKIILIIYFLSSLSLSANIFEPSHFCIKPYKPYEFTDQYQLDIYNISVNTYKSCIQIFINEQDYAIKKHLNAKNSAIDEWNNFINYGY